MEETTPCLRRLDVDCVGRRRGKREGGDACPQERAAAPLTGHTITEKHVHREADDDDALRSVVELHLFLFPSLSLRVWQAPLHHQ